jgi:hypothetical protein
MRVFRLINSGANLKSPAALLPSKTVRQTLAALKPGILSKRGKKSHVSSMLRV